MCMSSNILFSHLCNRDRNVVSWCTCPVVSQTRTEVSASAGPERGLADLTESRSLIGQVAVYGVPAVYGLCDV